MKNLILLLIILTTLSACGFKVGSKGSHSGNFISGTITPFLGSIAESHSSSLIISSASAAVCANPVYAKIYKLEDDGTILENSPLASQLVGPDARYSFNTKTLGLAKNSNVQFLLKAEGCNNEVYKRPVTDFNGNQNIDVKTSVIAEVLNANTLVTKKLNEVSRAQIESLINGVSGSSPATVYASLSTVPNASKFTQIFGVAPTILYDANPEVVLTVPTGSINEFAPTVFSVTATHIDPAYSYIYTWKLDGVVKSTSATWNYTPGSTAAGTHTVELFVGRNDGGGNLDTTKLYVYKSMALVINNMNVPGPAAASATLASASSTTSSSLTFTIADCTDRDFIFVSESIIAPEASDAGWQACSTVAGSITHTLVGPIAEGLHNLYIYAKNSSDGVSSATAATVIYDTVNPAVSLGAITAIRGGANSNVTFTATDASSGIQSLTLQYAADGTTFSNLASVTTSPYTWAVPASNIATAKLRLIALDNANNSQQVTTAAFTIDSTAPVFTQTGFVSGSYTNTNSVTMSGACQTGLSVEISGTETSTVACTAGAWSFATNKTSDENYGYVLTQTDAVGNATTINASWVRDATLPTASVTAPSASQLIQGGTTFNITWTAADDHLITNPIALQYSTNGGSTWNSITAATANTGTYAWSVPSNINSPTPNIKVKVIATDLGGNAAAAVSNNFSVDSTAPIVDLLSLDGGQALSGGQIYTISWSATDNNLNATPVNLSYSTDSGATWNAIATGISNSGYYDWTAPLINSSSVKIKVAVTDLLNLTGAGISGSNLIIDSANPTLALTYPTGGQMIKGDSAVNISWTANDANFITNPIFIEISADGGSSYNSLAANLANSGSYVWTVSQADNSFYRIRITALDKAGNSSVVASTSNITITRTGPNLTQTGSNAYYISNSANTVTYSGACDLTASMSSTTVTISGSDSATVSCTGSAPTGAWTWTTPSHGVDGIYSYTFSQTNNVAISTTIAVTWVRDATPPNVQNVYINDNSTYATSIMATAKVTASDTPSTTGLLVRVVTANTGVDCQGLYANADWQPQSGITTSFGVVLPSAEGVKKVCAWAKDQAGNVSTISPSMGALNTNMDEITMYNGSAPAVTSFSVLNDSGGANQGTSNSAAGEQMNISWTVTSTLGLDNDPIRLEYTTDNEIWNVIETEYGNQSGNPTSYSDNYTFYAPTSSYFRLRIIVKDKAGNFSPAALSNTQNTGYWSIFAGGTDRGVGRSAKTAVISNSQLPAAGTFAVALNNDVFLVDHFYGIKKISSLNGNIYDYIKYGTTNLSASGGTLSSSSRVNTASAMLATDRNGLLYVLLNDGKIYQINLTTNVYKVYAGGGSVVNATATSATVNVALGSRMTFDESNNLYFFTNCDAPAAWNNSTTASRILKLSQNSNGTAGSVSVVAGNCTRGTPTSGQLATSQPMDGNYATGSMLTVWNNGAVIYYRNISGTLLKIINGKSYTASLGTFSNYCHTAYSAVTAKLYVNCGDVRSYTPSIAESNGGEVLVSTIATANGTGDCLADGLTSSSACEAGYGVIDFLHDGTLIFTEGLNSSRKYRIRYVDSNNKMQTLAGTLPFYGVGKDKSVMSGSFGSIYYKKSTESNLTAFPEGLYFTDYVAPLWGRIETNNMVTQLFGSQKGSGNPNYATGTTLTPTLDPGGGSAVYSLSFTFNDLGLPWLLYGSSKVVSLDTANKFVRRSVNNTDDDFGIFAPGTAATSASINDNTAIGGLVVAKTDKLFLLGRYYNNVAPHTIQDPVLRLFDYSADNIVHLMGDSGITSTADMAIPGSLQTSSISSACVLGKCRMQFIENNPASLLDDQLYWAEGTSFRLIVNPTSPGSQTLATIFTTGGGVIQSFILSMDKSQVFYTVSGSLYCHDMDGISAKSWCNDSSLGPSVGLTAITNIPNQLTWKNATTLLISSGPQIYQFDVPAIP